MKRQLVSVCGFLTDDSNRLLIAKRADSETFMPGSWELIGGGVEYGENPADALKREFKEEFLIQVEIARPYFTFSYLQNENKEVMHEVEIDFFVKQTAPNQPIMLDKNTHSEYKWIAENEVENYFGKRPQPVASQLDSVLEGFKQLHSHKE